MDPKRIGILGFSAGGHLASTAATHFDDGRPDAADPDRARELAARLRRPLLRRHLPRRPRRPTRARAATCSATLADPALVELLSNEQQVTARTPPTFLWHTADDSAVPVENSLLFFEALHKAGVPGELHVFPHGRHGLGLAPGDPAVSQWPRLCAVWMEGLGLLKKQ